MPGRLNLMALLFVLGLPVTLWAATWLVRPDGTGDAPTIQAAIDSAGFNDVILLEDGVYVGEGNHDIIWRDRWRLLTVRSASGNPDQCVIDCTPDIGTRRGFILGRPIGEEAALDGVKIINAWHGYYGGAVHCDTAACLTIRNCVFEANHATCGAAICCTGGSPRINGCTFIGNRATTGGAVYVMGNFANIYISDCTFISNSAETGGAIKVVDGHATLRACTFLENSAVYDGGVLYCWELASVGIYACTMHRNVCGRLGSAVYCYSHNDIYCIGTIIAWGEGGEAIRLAPASNTAVISCSDIFGNDGGDWTGDIEDLLGIDGNFSACPSFCFADNGDLHLCDGSPCAPGNHPDGYPCDLIGAWTIGCSCGPTQSTPSTWGAIKAMYR
jgi:predicted outer membrane repeat protein